MNFITGSGIHCIFPELTFNKKGLRSVVGGEDRIARGVQKYAARGFSIPASGTPGGEETIQSLYGVDDMLALSNVRDLWSMKLPLSSRHGRLNPRNAVDDMP